MEPKEFRYYLKDAAGNYYYVAGKSVFATATPTPLKSDPMEWNETDLRWKRHKRYHGILTEFVVPLSFVNDAATILRHVCYTQEGIESKCTLYIERKKRKTATRMGDDTYEFFYQGDIDFSQKDDTLDYFQVAILDADLPAILQANESIPYEIPVAKSDSINVHLDGLRLKNTTTVLIANDPLATNTWHQMMPTMTIRENESEIKVDVIEQPNQQGLGTNALITGYPFFRASIAGTVLIDYDLSVLVGNSAGSSLGAHQYKMRITKWDGTTPTIYDLHTEPSFTNYVGTNKKTGTVSIPVNAGDTLVYFSGLFAFNAAAGSDAFVIDQTYNYSTFKIHYDLILPPTVIRAYRYYQLFQKLVAKLTDGAYSGYSDFLSNPNLTTVDNKPWNTAVTSGDNLRRLDWVTGAYANLFSYFLNSSITTTFEELSNDAADRWMTGIGVETVGGNRVVRLEHLSHFFNDNSITLDVGAITKLHVSAALEYIYNLLKVGIPDQEYDLVNGKDEPSTTQAYALPIIRKHGEWNMVAPYRNDMYGIEFHRANLADKPTTDSKNDNATFVLEVTDNASVVTLTDPSPAFNGNAYGLRRLQNNSGNSVSGLIAGDRAFNLSLTPKRNLIRNGALIHSALHQQDSKTIKFQTTDKNPSLVSNLGSGAIKESDDVLVSSLAAPLFLPMIFQFETDVPGDLSALITANPYGKIGFSYRGSQYYGFILEVGIRPADNAVCTWKLLATPSNDLSKLIH